MDIFGFDSADARIPVGVNNQVLIADSAPALGVKYALILNVNVDAAAAILHSKLESIVVATDQINTYDLGIKQNFRANATNAGLAVVPFVGNPTTQVNGDIWINDTTNQIFARINGADVDLGQSGAEVPVWTQDHDADGNNLTGIGYQNFDKITKPADPPTEEGRMYLKEIDASNNGLFILIQKAGSIVEVQIA